jgi:hypothetical protein
VRVNRKDFSLPAHKAIALSCLAVGNPEKAAREAGAEGLKYFGNGR